MRHVPREDGGPTKSSVAIEQPDTTNSTPHEEDSDAHGSDDEGAYAAGTALSAARRSGDRWGGREGTATCQSGHDKGCVGGRGNEVPERAERPEVKVWELLNCSICLFPALTMLCHLYRLVSN